MLVFSTILILRSFLGITSIDRKDLVGGSMLRQVPVFFLFLFLLIGSSVLAANVEKIIEGQYSCGVGAEALCDIQSGSSFYSFPVNSDVGEKILSTCRYDDMCFIKAIVDEYDNIISVISVGKSGDTASAGGGSVTSGSTGIFKGFRDYEWRQKIDVSDKKIHVYFGSPDGKNSVFVKEDDNFTLGDVKLTSIFYTLKEYKLVSVMLSWQDNSNFAVGRQVEQMLVEQIGSHQAIDDSDGYFIEKNGLKFKFKLKQDGQSLFGSLNISVIDENTQKGTF